MSEILTNTRKRRLSPKSFSEWLDALGKDGAEARADEREQSAILFARSLPGYGSAGERAARGGVSSSGFGTYLRDAAYAAERKREAEADKAARQESVSNARGYAAYLEQHEKDVADATKKVAGEIKSDAVSDYETAYEYAKSRGLGDKEAESAAKEAVSAYRRKTVRKVLTQIFDSGMTRAQAEAYAYANGLDTADCEQIGEFAELCRKTVMTQNEFQYLLNSTNWKG